MADEEPVDEDLSAEVSKLRYRLGSVTDQLQVERVRVRALPSVLFCLACLGIPMFRDLESVEVALDTRVGVWDLVNQAQAASNGAVEASTIVMTLALIAAAAWSATAAFVQTRPVALSGYALGALVAVAWAILLALVGASGGEGAIDELGYRITVAYFLIPFAAALVVSTALAVNATDR